MQWLSAADTNVGNFRSLNQDAIFVSPTAGLWLIADGMGGHDAGDYASEAIAQSVSEVTMTDDLAIAWMLWRTVFSRSIYTCVSTPRPFPVEPLWVALL